MTASIATASGPTHAISQRRMALITGLGLAFMAVLAGFAQFGVLQNLVVPADATATAANIAASAGLWRAGIGAFLVVAMLDILVAWGLYVVFRQVNETLALLVAWMRVVYAGVLVIAVGNLFDVVALLADAESSALGQAQLDAQVMSSIASFEHAWMIGLAIFGLHLVGLGFLVFGSTLWTRILGVLVVVAGGGYVVDSFGTILVPDYGLTVSVFTFVGEVLLMVWLLWIAARGVPSSLERQEVGEELPDVARATAAGRA